MGRVKKDGWNLQTNLKNKPNAQGTLFSGGTDQMRPEKRYPHGYTPERMRGVQSNVQVEGLQRGLGPYLSTRDDVYRTLARSTAPLSHMQGLHMAVRYPYDHGRDTLADADGYYSPRHGGSDGAVVGGSITVRPTALHGDTVIHELGHHASALAGNKHSRFYENPNMMGQEEGFADAYADKHFVEHPQAEKLMLEDRRGLANYTPHEGQVTDSAGFHRRESFFEGYNATRPTHARVPNQLDKAHAYSAELAESARVKRKTQPPLPGLENPESIRGNI